MDLPDGVPSKMIKSKEHGLTEVPNYAISTLRPREEEYSLSPFVCQWQKI